MTQNKRKVKYRKIVEWGFIRSFEDKPLRDNEFQWTMILYMIPIIGQILWLIGWVKAFEERKVYYMEIK